MDTEADGPVTWLFGGTKKERADLMRLGSPLSHITSDAPPFLIAHGTLDETVPFQQAEFLYAALTAVNVEVELIPLDGFYHNWTTQVENIPEREDTWKLGPMALPFFQKHLRP